MADTAKKHYPLVIIAGLSGSGKSTALDVFEDIGFFKIDGVPASLLSLMVEKLMGPLFAGYAGIVLGIDLRQEAFINDFNAALKTIRESGVEPRIIFFEAKTAILVNRYALTRRPHPLEKEGLGLEQALEQERKILENAKQMADLVLDTSDYSIHDLRRTLQNKWKAIENNIAQSLRIHLISFGFKYGTPAEADMVFDLRFLPNPYFDARLKPLSGQNEDVANYVLASDSGKAFYKELLNFLQFTLAQMEREGRYRVTIGIGCTGGRHRSVAMAEALALQLTENHKYSISLEHRHLTLG